MIRFICPFWSCAYFEIELNFFKANLIKIYLSIRNRLPFNWKTPLGYSIALSLQAIGTYCSSVCGVPTVCSMIGCCWLLATFVEDMTNDLANFETNDMFEASLHRNEIVEHFKNAVKSFVVVKQLSFYIPPIHIFFRTLSV